MRPLLFAIPAATLILVLSGCGAGGEDPVPAAPSTTATIDRIGITLHLDEPANARIDEVTSSGGPSQDITTEFEPGASGRFTTDGSKPPSRMMSSALTLTDGSGNRSQKTIELSLDR